MDSENIIHSFINYLLSVYEESSAIPDARDTIMHKIFEVSTPFEIIIN